MTTLIEARGLRAGYGAIEVLRNVDLDVAPGEVLAILGANGAGKTTLLRALSAMIPSTGAVRFAGREVGRTRTHALARLGMAHVPEHRGTFAELTVEENLRLGAQGSGRSEADRRSDREEVYGLFPKLRERRFQQAGTLSGGEQQMLAIGRALALKPALLLLDEPSFGLAPQIVAEIYRVLRRLKDENRVGMILVEQHAALALELADNAIVLTSGQVAIRGPATLVRADRRVQDTYLGHGAR